MTRIFLHAGTQKTGTTAIQGFARSNRATLLDRGLLFPDPEPFAPDGPQPHHSLAHAVAGTRGPLKRSDIAPMLAGWAEQAARHSADILISAEPMWRQMLSDRKGDEAGDWRPGRLRYLRRLAKHLGPFGDVVPVLVFRRPEDYLVSAFRESVSQAAVLTDWKDFPGFRRQSLKKRLRYHGGAVQFARIFGPPRTLIFEDLIASGPLSHGFFQALGVDVTGLPDPGVVRPGPGLPETMLKLALLRQGGHARKDAALVQTWLQSPETGTALDRIFGPGPFSLWEDAGALDRFRTRMAGETERLRAGFFPDRAVLFPAPDGPLPPPMPFPEAELAALVAEAPFAPLAPVPRKKPRPAPQKKKPRARSATPDAPSPDAKPAAAAATPAPPAASVPPAAPAAASPAVRKPGSGRRILLHAGMPKSGSSALQYGLTQMRGDLQAHGYLYPKGLGASLNHAILAAGIQPKEQLSRLFQRRYGDDTDRLRTDLERWTGDVETALKQDGIHTLILSAEAFYFLTSPETLTRMKEILARFGADPEVILYARRPSEFYISAVQQTLKASHRIRSLQPIPYRQRLEALQTLTPVPLRVFRYDRRDFPDGDILKHFLQTFCPEMPPDTALPDTRRNESISAEGMAILQDYRRTFHDGAHNVFTADTADLIEAIQRADARLDGNTRPRVLPEIAGLLDRGTPDLRWLRDRFGIVFDGVDYDSTVRPEDLVLPQNVADICTVDEAAKLRTLLHVVQMGLKKKPAPAASRTRRPPGLRGRLSGLRRRARRLFSGS